MVEAGELWHKFLEKKHEPEYLRNVLIGLATIMAMLTIPFLICSFAVAETANAGFNVILTGFMLVAWEVGSIWLMQRGPGALSYGFFLGSSLMMTVVTFLTAIYWGQLSQCDTDYDDELKQYTCTHTGFMGGVCAFAVFIWFVQLPFMALAYSQRNVIIGNIDTEFDNGQKNSPDFSFRLSANNSYSSHSSRNFGGNGRNGAGMPPPIYDL